MARGRNLFIAKGCVTCLTHAGGTSSYFSTGIGGSLAGYEVNASFLLAWLRNAEKFTADRQWPMPTLELTDAEIDALVAFLDEEVRSQ